MKYKFSYIQIIDSFLYFVFTLITVFVFRYFDLFQMGQLSASKIIYVSLIASILLLVTKSFFKKR